MERGDKLSNYIEVQNDRTVVINDTYKNVSLVKQIDAVDCWHARSGDGGSSMYTNGYYEIPCQVGDIWAYHAENMSAPIYPSLTFGHQGLFTGLSIGWGSSYTGSYRPKFPRGTATFFIFRWQIGSGGLGIEIKNERGEQIFDSSLKYLRIIDVIKEDVNSANWSPRSYNHKIAIVPCCFPLKYPGYGDQSAHYSSGIGIMFTSPTSFSYCKISANGDTVINSKPEDDLVGTIHFLVIDIDGII